MKVIVYAHTHWDREWYKPFEEFRLRLIEVIDRIVEEILSEKLDCFYLDGQTIILEDYFNVYPEKKHLILKLIKNKKIMIGPWYVLADEFLVSGESLIRNMLIGINEANSLNCHDFIGYLPDSFGHTSEIPRILNSFGIQNSVLWRGAGNLKSEFIWKSQDGSSILATHLIEGYFQDIFHQNCSFEEKAKNLTPILDKIKKSSLCKTILLPAGGDHLGVASDLNAQLEEINKHLEDYTMYNGSIKDYITSIENQNTTPDEITGELRDNSQNPILPGTFSTRLYLKQANARSTWQLSKLAEPLYTLIQNSGILSDKRNEFNYAWKLLLKNHPHDSICGCSVDEVHDEMMNRYAKVDQISEGLIGRCFHALSEQTEKGKFIVYNASNYAYTGTAKVKTAEKLPESLISQHIGSNNEFPKEILFDIRRVPVQEDMQAYNEYLVWVEDIKPHSIQIIDNNYKCKKTPDLIEIGENFIKNSKISLIVEKNGTLSIKNLENNKNFNNLHIFYDYADKGDTYNFCPIKEDQPKIAKLTKTEIIENGDLRKKLRLVYEIEIPESLDKKELHRSTNSINHTLSVVVTIHSGSKRIEFQTKWENQSKDHVLQIKFKFDKNVEKTVSENTFGVIERKFDPNYSLKQHMPAPKNIELSTNTAPMQRFVWTNGLGIITEGLSEYGVNNNELYITILRSVGILSRGAIDTRGVPAGPPLKTPKAQCLGTQTAHYALVPTDNPLELFEQADNFMGSILVEEGYLPDNSNTTEIEANLLKINNPNIYTYAVKSPQDTELGGIVARLMNLSGEEQTVTINSLGKFKAITNVNSLEDPLSHSKPINSEITFKPYELKSLLLK